MTIKAVMQAMETERTRQLRQARLTPDSELLHRSGQPQDFFYLEHRTVNSNHNIAKNWQRQRAVMRAFTTIW